MSNELKGRKIAILATDGFEQVELTDPKKNVEAAGATTEVLSVKDGSIKGWKFTEWGDTVPVDKQVSKANVDDYDALILPGGQINPDKLRMEKAAVDFVQRFVKTGKPVFERERLSGLADLYASPAEAAGRIYITDRDGTTLVLKAGDKLDVLATNRLGDPIDASPVIVGKQLFLRGEKYLYCIEDGGK